MVGRRKTNLTPSLEEFTGWYNLSEPYDDGLPVLRSVELVPEFHHAEFFDLYFEAAKWFKQLVDTPAEVPFDPFEELGFFVRSDADDRTLGVEVDFQILTLDLLRRIQTEFLGRHPLWRVVLVAEQMSLAIVVYPTTIRYGSLPVSMDPHEALRTVTERQVALVEARLRPRREHFAWIQRLLPDAVKRIGDRPFLVAGVLDNYEGDYERLTICLLIRGGDREAVIIKGPPGADRHLLWRSSAYRVSDEGVVINCDDDAAPYCLVPWLPPADYRGPLRIVERESKRKHTFELKSEGVITTNVAPSAG
jgi:hypothetical protein